MFSLIFTLLMINGGVKSSNKLTAGTVWITMGVGILFLALAILLTISCFWVKEVKPEDEQRYEISNSPINLHGNN
ncbi:hypothetical protein TVAG_080970 [Trichomonas vaginalis G3]|uniref:Uncharacterized protein n=1 Tax=Trichomonas vaginalis (strain ATCC PRA-98 / G3) TaxID=412133 RepID=A2EPC0_TRIV3|nr:hypothetical protein TVAGG3_0679610 [Trichomonas vaginalis G3]EAY05505.1 hypothetical protein TVAG_080970 [Trichomonas vaginalis G3]KAI5507808.1 hypothetical protein TVAGG3_0679610 [Trichomonas vaginalis G3]|eukprot:XP_001317728.1 hypothetical protein [Trichomonas vaginalis G3]